MKTLLIDLDGVLNEYKGEYDPNFIPPLKNGAREFLEELSKNYEIKLFTTRNKILASKWLIDEKLENIVKDITNTKDVAYLYIDDRCICFDGNFEKLKTQIKNFQPWYK